MSEMKLVKKKKLQMGKQHWFQCLMKTQRDDPSLYSLIICLAMLEEVKMKMPLENNCLKLSIYLLPFIFISLALRNILSSIMIKNS